MLRVGANLNECSSDRKDRESEKAYIGFAVLSRLQEARVDGQPSIGKRLNLNVKKLKIYEIFFMIG